MVERDRLNRNRFWLRIGGWRRRGRGRWIGLDIGIRQFFAAYRKHQQAYRQESGKFFHGHFGNAAKIEKASKDKFKQ